MGAVRTLAGAQLRGEGRRAVALVLVVGVALGVVVAAAAGARRTQTSFDRFADYSRLPDIAFFGPLDLVESGRHRPEVLASAASTYVPLDFIDVPPDEKERLVPFVSLHPGHLRQVERPIVVAGRLPAPGRAEEVAVSEKVADRRHARPGATLRARTFTADDLASLDDSQGFPQASGPVLGLRVTGVIRQASDLTRTADDQGDFVSGEEMVYLTPAFWRAHGRQLPEFGEQAALLVRLRDGVDPRRFEQGVIGANNGDLPSAGDEGGFFSPDSQLGSVRRAIDVEATSLYAFASITGMAALLLGGLAVARRSRAAIGDFPALSAVGLSVRQLVAAAALRNTLLGIAAVVAVAIAVVLSPLAPVGLARLAEPDPGVELNLTVVLGTAVAGAAVLVLVAAGSTWRAARALRRADPAPARPSVVTRALARSGAGPAAVTGTRFALEQGGRAVPVPVRTTLAGAVLGAMAVATAVTFGAGFDRVLDTSALQGAPWDAIASDPSEGDGERVLREDPRIQSFASGVTVDAGTEDRYELVLVGVRGPDSLLPPVVRGRHPRDGEVALTRQAADRLGVGLGDTVGVGATGGSRRLRVVGIVPVAAQLLADRSGEGVLTDYATAAALAGEDAERFWAVRWRPGVDQQRARDALHEQFGAVVRPFRSPDVRNVTRVSWLPYGLAGVLGLLSLATLAHTLVTSVRRRGRDLAVLKTLGLDRRQVARTVRWQASTVAVVGAVVGIPAGVAAGRWVWRLVGERMGVVPEPVTPWLIVLAILPGLLLLANMVALAPARRAARTRPAVVLRTE